MHPDHDPASPPAARRVPLHYRSRPEVARPADTRSTGTRSTGTWLAAVLGLSMLAGPAAATEWFVAPGGDDVRGNGSARAPFATIARAIRPNGGGARAGDTVTVLGPAGNNTYNECDVRLRVPLTLRSPPGERAHIHCDIDTPDSVAVQIDPGASGSRLSNLEISGGRYYAVMMQTDWYSGGGEQGKGATDIVLEDLLIHDTGRDGIKITPKSDNVTIRRCEIRDTGAIYPPGTPLEKKNADGIDNVNGSGMVVEDCYIHDIATTGLYFKGGATDVLVQRNRIENTGMAGILVGFDTSPEYFDTRVNPRYYESIRGVVRNNLVRNTDYAGIGLYAASDAVVANNTIIDAARRGHAALYFGVPFQDWDPAAGRPPSHNPRLVNNLVSMPGRHCIEIRHSSELGGVSGLDGAPGSNWNGFEQGACRFVDGRPGGASALGTLASWRATTGADADSIQAAFRLDAQGRPAADSATVDAGTRAAGVDDDIDGRRREHGYDLGAFEVGNAVAGQAADTRVAAPGADFGSDLGGDPGGGPGQVSGSAAGPGSTDGNGAVRGPATTDPHATPVEARSPMWPLPWIALVAALVVALGVALAGMAYAIRLIRQRNVTGWLLAYLRQDWRAPVPAGTTRHLLFCFVDHFEPAWGQPGLARENARVARWRRELPELCAAHRDSEGRPPVHSFFYPGEEYRPEHIDALVELCRLGLGEIEIHLHHDNDTETGLREKLGQFARVLASRHDALPRDPFSGQPRWAFIHGDWALDNSHPSGRHCGVDNELVVLREEGCYADFTFPAAPDPCQTRTINRIYYAKDDPARPKSHDTGNPVHVGGAEEGDLMIIQGPLGLRWNSRKFGIFPRIENGDVRASCPPTRERIDGWVDAGIHVAGRPEWIVVKVHTHGAEDADMDTLLGGAMDRAYSYLESRYNDGRDWKLHYVSARETYNIIKAAEAGHHGDPGQFRDFQVPRPGYGIHQVQGPAPGAQAAGAHGQSRPVAAAG